MTGFKLGPELQRNFKNVSAESRFTILFRDWSKSIEGGGPEQRGGGS